MKIAFDIRGAHLYHGTGIGTYTKNLIKHLLKIDMQNSYELFYCGKNPSEFKKSNTNIHLISRKHSSFFEQKYIPNIIQNTNTEIFHIPQNGVGYKDLSLKGNSKIILTLHDLIPFVLPQTVGKTYLKNFLKQIPYVIEKSSKIITVSEYSKQEIIKFFSIDPEKVSVTPLATNKLFSPMPKELCQNFLREKYNINYNFMLYIGGFSKRKNIYNLILAYEKAYKNFDKDTKLILLGNIREEFKILDKLIREKNLEDKIIFTGFIPENELPIFYNASEFFIYISLYEGFGLPVLEAMSCKKAVLNSNLTSIPEIVRDASYSVNPYNILEISEALCGLSNNSSLRENLESKAYIQSKNFSWEKCATLTLNIYNQVLNKF